MGVIYTNHYIWQIKFCIGDIYHEYIFQYFFQLMHFFEHPKNKNKHAVIDNIFFIFYGINLTMIKCLL